MSAMVPAGRAVALDEQECRRLLDGGGLGRVAVTVGAVPVVWPVAFGIVDGQVILRATLGSSLHRATADAVVAFEVDDLDATCRDGWCVQVVGLARHRRASEASPGPLPLAVGEGLVTITDAVLSGHRFVPG